MKRLRLCLISLTVVVCLCVGFVPSVGSAPPRSPHADNGNSLDAGSAVTIPGPLRSFRRMAGISQKVSPDEVMPLLARNVFLRGYSGQGSSVRPTEFLILLRRYVDQARELAALAGPEGTIRVSGCADAQRVLQVLGYRVRPDCGQANTYVETADPQRAFLTTDSGFPLPELEKTLQGGPAFSYEYPNFQLPILLSERDWTSASERTGKLGKDSELLDLILRDPAMARLY